MRAPIFDYRITDYDRALLPSEFLAAVDRAEGGPDDWIASSGRSIGYPGWGLLYHLLLCRLDPAAPNLVVETGTNVGSSTIVLAKALADSGRPGVVRTVEIDPDIAAQARANVKEAGVAARVEFYVGDSLGRLPEMLAGDDPIPVAFLDGNHFHDHVVAEFELVLPRLSHDSIVVFDNTYLIAEGDEDPRVHGALRTIVARHGGHLVNLPFCSWYTPGIALWQRQPFDDMVPPAPDSFVPDKSG